MPKQQNSKQRREHNRIRLELARDMPRPAKAPELLPNARNPEGIRIGGTAGEIDVNFCLNTACGNFGLPWHQARDRGQGYRILRQQNALRIQCTECAIVRKIYNNEAVNKMFLHTLKNALAHEYCNKECENHRVNFYEHFGTRYKRAARRSGEARCLQCGARFHAGQAFRLHGKGHSNTGNYRYIRDYTLFMKLVCNNVGPSPAIDILDCHPENYYSVLHNLAATCNAVSAAYLMRLQSKEYAKSEGNIRLYSDIMEITIHLGGDETQHCHLKYLVTVTDFGNSFFVLAGTPMFFPAKGSRLERQLIDSGEGDLLECHRDHAHLLWGGVVRYEDRRFTADARTLWTVTGLDGYFIQSSYGALGHFLVLRKMLAAFKQVTHYVDNERVLYMAALTAFADRIRENRCDVVLIAHSKTLSKETAGKENSAAYAALEEVFPERNSEIQDDEEPDEERKQAEQKYKENLKRSQKEFEKRKAAFRRKKIAELVGKIGLQFREAVEEYKNLQPAIEKSRRWPNREAHVFGRSLDKGVPWLEKRYRKRANWDAAKKKNAASPQRERLMTPRVALWVRDPFPPVNEPRRGFLWLTRGLSWEDSEREVRLYMDGKLQPVDTFFASLRQVSSVAQRPPPLAGTGGRAFKSMAQLPQAAISELALVRFRWNFMRRRRTGKEGNVKADSIPRAHNLGILGEEALTMTQTRRFRAGVFRRAQEITKWLGT